LLSVFQAPDPLRRRVFTASVRAIETNSIAASFGISVLIWQDLFGIPVHWLVILMSVIILLAVGSDYNLLLVSRFKDEIHAGLKTGIIRSMAGTRGVVTSAGLVFAVTMAAMLGSKLIVLAQMGSTIALGLLVDTLIVRSLLMPSIATLPPSSVDHRIPSTSELRNP
jgi:RND superfamily putative drug exporter